MEKRIGKRDLILLAVMLAAALIVLGIFQLPHREDGAVVQVTVNGDVYGAYDLTEDQKVEITIGQEVTNILLIKDRKADMTEADCPDKLCVHQKAISKAGETIVCLPNKVVVEIVGGTEKSEFDAIAQ